MERHANFALVGAISIVLLIAGLVFVVWLAQYQFNQKYDVYQIILKGPVSGLSRGGEVQFNGIKIGDIKSIELDPVDPNRVITEVELEHNTPVRVDSVAQLMSQGITGVKYIQVTPGTPSKPLLRKVSKIKPPIIIAERSRLENFLNNTSQLVLGATKAVDRINRVLSDANITTISGSLNDIGALTAEMRTRKAMFGKIESTFTRFDKAASEFQRLAGAARASLGDRDQGTLHDLSQTAKELHLTVVEARKVFSGMNKPVSELSTTTMPNINNALTSIQQAADSMDHLVTEIRQDPRGLIGRPRAREKELRR